MHHRLFVFPAVLSALALGSPAPADPAGRLPFLSPLFTDNMVMQRGQTDPVWGWTTPGASVTVSISGKKAVAVAGTDGEWTAKLPPLPAGGPYTLTVSGPQAAVVRNVLVGDVWVCSGQSNMEFGVGNGVNAQQEIAAADYPNIRLFTATKVTALGPLKATGGSWSVCTPENIMKNGTWSGFTAVGYFFGRALYQALHVPIGLIQSSWGGTPAEAWTDEAVLRQKVPDFGPQLASMDDEREAERQGTVQSLAARLAAWYTKNDPGSAGGLGWADPALDDSAWPTMALPGFFQDAGVPDLAKTNGIIWFRRRFDLQADVTGKPLVLHLVADDNDTTWINGTQVGATEGWQTPRAYTVPASLLKTSGNVIAVRVLDTGGKGGIYGDPSGLSLTAPDGKTVALAGSWHYRLGIDLTKATPVPQNFANNPNAPAELYNGMIAPLIPFGIKGAIWYQGESNAGRGNQYRALLPALIGSWRGNWGQGSFPFLIVQLAGWGPGGDSWADLREAQWLTAKTVPNTGIATAIDVGDKDDIHPKNKQDVGKRLALAALAQVYRQKVEYSGPVYTAMERNDSAIRLTFSHLGGGLLAKDGGPLTGFTVAGADQHFVAADAKIVGDAVVVSSPQVPHPVAVRYAWSSYPMCSLYNRAGLPAFPFRTDNWTGATQ